MNIKDKYLDFQRKRKIKQLKSAIKDYQNLVFGSIPATKARNNLIEELKPALDIINKFEYFGYISIEDYEYLKKYLKIDSNLNDENEIIIFGGILKTDLQAIIIILSKIQQLAKELSLSINSVKIELSKTELSKLSKEFYIIPKEYIISHTTQSYRDFLKQANYMDLDSADGLLVEKKISKTKINWSDSKNLIEKEGYKLLTAGLIYLVFIPYLKEKESQGEKGVIETLNEMMSKYAEWLEDKIINKNTLKINNKEIEINLIQQDGRFDKEDINEYGYPEKLKEKGEYYYWYPRNNEIATIRDWNSVLGLSLMGGPSFVGGWLGVRRTKIFNFKKEIFQGPFR